MSWCRASTSSLTISARCGFSCTQPPRGAAPTGGKVSHLTSISDPPLSLLCSSFPRTRSPSSPQCRLCRYCKCTSVLYIASVRNLAVNNPITTIPTQLFQSIPTQLFQSLSSCWRPRRRPSGIPHFTTCTLSWSGSRRRTTKTSRCALTCSHKPLEC